MEAAMQVSKWGNSLAVRLPKQLVDQMCLIEGDEIVVVDTVGRMLIVEKQERRGLALKKMAARAWKAPADYKFNRDEANER
jgi:antitoxin MazE